MESIGDCVVVVDDDEIIKVHVHSNHPGNAIEEGLKFGMLTSLKIENMREQHSAQVLEAELVGLNETYVAPDPEVPFGFAAVAAGAGIQHLFSDLGVNQVVTGGQTMNPSTDDILNAIQSIPAKTIFVLQIIKTSLWRRNKPRNWRIGMSAFFRPGPSLRESRRCWHLIRIPLWSKTRWR